MSTKTVASFGPDKYVFSALHVKSTRRSDLCISNKKSSFLTKPSVVTLKSSSISVSPRHQVTFGEGSPVKKKLK